MKYKSSLFPLILFVLVVGLSLGFLQWMFMQQVKLEKKGMLVHLSSIAEFQSQAISVWRQSRLWDAELLRMGILHVLHNQTSQQLDVELLADIRHRLQEVIKSGHYLSVNLHDAECSPLIEISSDPDYKPNNIDCISHQVGQLNESLQLTDIHELENKREHLSISFSVATKEIKLATLTLEIDPHHTLYKINQPQLTHQVRVETVLHQLEYDGFRVLSGSSTSVQNQQKFAVKQRGQFADLINSQQSGALEFEDRFGSWVIGYLTQVPDTYWFIVTKANHDEVLTALLNRRNTMFLLMLMFSGLVGLLIISAIKIQRSKDIARSEALLSAIIQQTGDAVSLMDQNGGLKLVNPAFVNMSGYTFDELNNQHDQPFQPMSATFPQQGDFVITEQELQRKNGHCFDAEFSTSVIELGGQLLKLDVIRDISEKKRIEEKLQLLQFAVDRSHDSVFLLNSQGDFHYVNQAACKSLKYSREVLLSLNVTDIDPQYPVELWDEHWNEIYSKGQMIFETIHQRSDGSRYSVEVDVSYFSFKDQHYLFAIAQDISERKQAELELAQQTDLLEAVFNDIPDAMVLADENRRIVKVNPGMSKIFGYTEQELIGRLTKDLYAEEADFINQGKIRFHLTADEKLAPYAVNYRRKDGTVFPGETVGVPVKDRDGKFLGFIAVTREITDRITAEQALRDSEAHFRAIFEQAQDSIVLVDPQTHGFIEFNEHAYRDLGYTREEFCRLTISDIEANMDADEINRHTDNVITTGMDAFETRHRTRQGEIKNRLVNINRIELAGSYRYMTIWRDITEQKRLEQELKQAHKMEAIGLLTGGIAHDFNNILATILGFAHLARSSQEKLSQDKMTEYLDTILQAGNRGRELVKQMLSFSPDQPAENIPVIDLDPLLREVSKLLSSVLPSCIELKLEIADSLPAVEINPVKFHQVVMNLCLNARDAMPGKGMLQLKLKPVDITEKNCSICHKHINGQWVMLSVSDTGTGMDSETLLRIFDPFFTTKQVSEGTGMGLAVVHGIMTGSGGHVLVHSKVGQGSEIKLLFPPANGEIEQQVLKQDVEKPLYVEGHHLLVVDDEPTLVSYLSELLQDEGYRVTGITDSRQALALFESEKYEFSLLISDQTMPNLTGIELATQLKLNHINVPVLLCSGYSETISEDMMQQAGVQQMLTKPVKPELLLRTIASLIKTSHSN